MNWLLLRGLAREGRHWHTFPDKIKNLKGCENVFTIDYLGVGSKNEKKSPLKISQYVDDLRSEWLKMKEEHPGEWGVIAISMGGMMALDWTDRFEDDFTKTVLINTSTRDVAPVYRRLSFEAIGTFSKAIFNTNTRDREKNVLGLTVKMGEIDDELLDLYTDLFEDRPINRLNFLRQVFAASHYKLPKKVKTDTLVLAGKKDKLAHYQCSIEIAKRLNATLELHEQAGHDLPIDDPDWILKMITKHYFESK